MGLKITIYLGTIYLAFFEAIQIKDKGWVYLSDIVNWIDMFSLGLSAFLLIIEELKQTLIDEQFASALAAMVVLLTWTKFFYWMRLFNQTAFFINLLTKTFCDKNFVAFIKMLIILTL